MIIINYRYSHLLEYVNFFFYKPVPYRTNDNKHWSSLIECRSQKPRLIDLDKLKILEEEEEKKIDRMFQN